MIWGTLWPFMVLLLNSPHLYHKILLHWFTHLRVKGGRLFNLISKYLYIRNINWGVVQLTGPMKVKSETWYAILEVACIVYHNHTESIRNPQMMLGVYRFLVTAISSGWKLHEAIYLHWRDVYLIDLKWCTWVLTSHITLTFRFILTYLEWLYSTWLSFQLFQITPPQASHHFHRWIRHEKSKKFIITYIRSTVASKGWLTWCNEHITSCHMQ